MRRPRLRFSRSTPIAHAAFRAAAALALGVMSAPAAAADVEPDQPLEPDTTSRPPPSVDPFADKPGLVGLMGTALVGTGLRFNNPYRLATPLGADAESVSRTSSFVDLGIGVTLFGRALGLRHGPALRATFALEGISQAVLTPSYFVTKRKGALAAWGRAGLPIVVTPDVTWGFEAAVGGAYYMLGGIGIAGEVVGDVFYGAGTAEVATATYPVLSAQLGLIVSYEALP